MGAEEGGVFFGKQKCRLLSWVFSSVASSHGAQREDFSQVPLAADARNKFSFTVDRDLPSHEYKSIAFKPCIMIAGTVL